MLDRVVKILTSLRLTVLLLAFAILLVFFGTIAQVNEGLYLAQSRWFRSFFVWWPEHGTGLRVPFMPGGYLIGSLLLVNLIAAHIARFKFTWAKLGINLAHFGIILLLAGQLITDLAANESVMSFAEGESRNYSVNQGRAELVFATDGGDHDKIVSVPQAILSKGGELKLNSLPFGIRVKEYHANASVFTREDALKAYDQLSRAVSVVGAEFGDESLLIPMAEKALQTPGRIEVWQTALKAVGETDNADILAAAKRVAAKPALAKQLAAELKAQFQKGMYKRFRMQGGAMAYAVAQLEAKHEISEENPPPAATTDGYGRDVVMYPLPTSKTMDDVNTPGALVELYNEKGALGTWLVHPNLTEQVLEVGAQRFRFALRFERLYHPFTVTLLKTTHEVYRGTDIPKNFQSRVRIENPTTKESREVDIYMNNPLRYGGMTFFQYQMGRDQMDEQRGTSALQVVRNPGWLTPYAGCALVGAGLVIQFMSHLLGFIKKRKAN